MASIEERLLIAEATLEIMRLKARYASCADGKYTEDHQKRPQAERDAVARQQADIDRLRADEAVRLPAELDYVALPGLSNEMVERLSAARPSTLGAAARIRGVTPAALAAILIHARRKAA